MASQKNTGIVGEVRELGFMVERYEAGVSHGEAA
jgi:hypothetical protein